MVSLVMIVIDELSNDLAEVLLAQRHNFVEGLPPGRQHELFGICV